MNDNSETDSFNSDSSYVIVENPIEIESASSSRSKEKNLRLHFPPDEAIMSLNNSIINAEAGLLPHHSAFYKNEKTRRRQNICRIWHSFSRFQRNLLTATFLLTLCSCLFLASSFYIRARVTTTEDEKNSNVLDEVEYRKKAHFPKDIIVDKLPGPTVIENTVKNVEKLEEDKMPVLAVPKTLHFSGPQNERQTAVVEAFKHAWKGYKLYAWGHDHLKPISKTSHDWFGLGLTIVDSLDTMLIMGLNEEYNESRSWVATSLNMDVDKYVNLFETTIRVVGGLLSAYHLSGDELFLKKAIDLGDRLLGAFETPSRLPYSDVNLHTKDARLPVWGPDSSLSEVTTIQLEFRALSRASKNPIYEAAAFNVSHHVHNLGCAKYNGLCPMFINPKTGEWRPGFTITMGARSDSYYEYLLKQWLQTGKTVSWLKDDYAASMDAMVKHLMRYSQPNRLTYIGEVVNEKSFSPKMDHLVCFIAGTLALGNVNGFPAIHMDYAKQLAHTCHEMYRNPTGLSPEIAHFNMLPTSKDDIFVKNLDAHCLLRPEAIESWFYLYRLTGDKNYQNWGWEAFQAIEKYAKVDHGYSSVNNVKKTPVTYKDMMESFYLAETLKYLYLLFADDQSILPLNEYVFNTEAHPLPIYPN